MEFIIRDVAYNTAKKALEANGFGIDETLDASFQPLTAEVWTTVGTDGVLYGFVCGRLVRHSFSFGHSFELIMDDHHLRDDCDNAKERFAKVVQLILKRTSIR